MTDPLPGSITMDQPGPYYPGVDVKITCTYDQDARKGNRTPQYPFHPQLQAFYTQYPQGTLGYWFVDPEVIAEKVRSNHDGTFTASGIPVPMNVLPLRGWDATRPGRLGLAVLNVKDVKGIQTFTDYASAEFDIAVAPAP